MEAIENFMVILGWFDVLEFLPVSVMSSSMIVKGKDKTHLRSVGSSSNLSVNCLLMILMLFCETENGRVCRGFTPIYRQDSFSLLAALP